MSIALSIIAILQICSLLGISKLNSLAAQAFPQAFQTKWGTMVVPYTNRIWIVVGSVFSLIISSAGMVENPLTMAVQLMPCQELWFNFGVQT